MTLQSRVTIWRNIVNLQSEVAIHYSMTSQCEDSIHNNMTLQSDLTVWSHNLWQYDVTIRRSHDVVCTRPQYSAATSAAISVWDSLNWLLLTTRRMKRPWQMWTKWTKITLVPVWTRLCRTFGDRWHEFLTTWFTVCTCPTCPQTGVDSTSDYRLSLLFKLLVCEHAHAHARTSTNRQERVAHPGCSRQHTKVLLKSGLHEMKGADHPTVSWLLRVKCQGSHLLTLVSNFPSG